MKVGEARFLGAAAVPGGGPPPGLPEIAIAGRSNVGKSSLLNALVGRRGLARISATPGRTRQINFFVVDERFVLVDLPGYGFAVGPEAERRAWGPLVERYLAERSTLCGVLVLVDLRRGVEADEVQLLAHLDRLGLPAAVVATKSDKLARGAARTALAAQQAALGAVVPLIPFSARTGEGRSAVWRLGRAWLVAGPRRAAPGRLTRGRAPRRRDRLARREG
jgi:GTP-binding protein